MKIHDHINAGMKNDPGTLQRLLVKSAIVSIILILLVSGYGFYRVFSGFVIRSAEDDSVHLCQSLLEQQKDLLIERKSSDLTVTGLSKRNMDEIDRMLRRFLAPFGIIKVKIYDAEGRIVYCTEPQLIGKVDAANIRLRDALSGIADAKLVTAKKARDLAEEQLVDVDVVETYVPIRLDNGKILGCFEVYQNVTPYREQIRRGVAIAAGFMIIALSAVFGFSYLLIRRGTGEIRQTQSRLEAVAITDTLTGISNRSHLMQRGFEEFEQVRRVIGGYRRKLGCIMLDVDRLKVINDTKGHQAGDEVLKEIAVRLKQCVRPYDVAGRYGGEEFVVLLPETSFEQSLIVAERIRAGVAGAPIVVRDGEIRVTVSLGVTSSNETDSGLSDIIKRADEGLCKAKESGRDRVSWVYHPFDTQLHS